jgi:hypothetical protein
VVVRALGKNVGKMVRRPPEKELAVCSELYGEQALRSWVGLDLLGKWRKGKGERAESGKAGSIHAASVTWLGAEERRASLGQLE